MNTFLTKDKTNFVKLGVPQTEYCVTTIRLDIPNRLEFGKVYYYHNNGVLKAFKILAYAVEYTSERKGITYFVQFPNGETKWIFDFINQRTNIYDSKEDFISYAGNKTAFLAWQSIPDVLRKHFNDMFINDIWECKNGVVKNSNNYVIHYMLFTKEGCSVCVGGYPKYVSTTNPKIYLSKEECIKASYDGMVVEDFGETTIKVDIRVEMSKPITSVIKIVEE